MKVCGLIVDGGWRGNDQFLDDGFVRECCQSRKPVFREPTNGAASDSEASLIV